MDLSTNCQVPVKVAHDASRCFKPFSFFFYDNFNDLCFPFNCSSPFLPLSAPYLHASLRFFLKAIPFCCVGCHSSYTETFQSISTAWPDTCAGSGYAHKKETKGFWLSWYGPKSSTDRSQHLLQLCFPCVRTTLVSTLKPLVHIFSTECTFCHLFHCSQKAKELEGTWKCTVTFWVKQRDYCWNQSHPLTGTNVCF